MYKEKLKNLREEKDLNQYVLSELLNLNKDVYGQYEREYTIIPIKHLNTICNYFNVSLDYVFSFSNSQRYDNASLEINNKLSGERLRELRKSLNLTQDKLAKILKTAPSVIGGYEKGRRLIATPFLYTICKKYNISADYLLGKIDTNTLKKEI